MVNKLDFFTDQHCRLVYGDLDKKRTKDHENKPLPEDKQSFSFGVTLNKAHPDTTNLLTKIYQFCASEWSSYPQLQQRLDAWWSTKEGLSMKISDGDKPNQKGQLNENTKGCYVLWFNSMYPINCVDNSFGEIDSSAIKRGDYVMIAGNVRWNEKTDHNAGIYVNVGVVRLTGIGESIGGINAEAAFSDATVGTNDLPPGAQAPGAQHGMPQHHQPPAAPAAALPAAPPAAPAAPVQPHYGVMDAQPPTNLPG